MKKLEQRAELLPAKRRANLSPGEALRTARELQEMTQSELAAASGLEQATISAMENGRVTIGIERAKKLARALHVHPAVLVFADWASNDERAPSNTAKRAAKRTDVA